MPTINKQKRKQIENKVINTIKKLDPDPNGNIKLYQEFFTSLSDTQFTKWIQDIKTKKTKLFFFFPPFKSLKNDKLIKIAKELGVNLFHRIIFEDENGKQTISNAKHLVLKLHIRRLIQSLENKIGLPEDDKHISTLTGAVIKPSKGAKLDAEQCQVFLTKNLDNVLLELFNVRGGNTEAYFEFKNILLNKGEANLNEINTVTRPKGVDVTISILRGMGFNVELKPIKLPKSVKKGDQ